MPSTQPVVCTPLHSARRYGYGNQADVAKLVGCTRANIARYSAQRRAVLVETSAGVELQTLPTEGRLKQAEKRRARALEMAEKYKAGATLQELGDYYGITRERVRQLMSRELGVTGEDGGVAKRARDKRAASKRRRELNCIRKWGITLEKRRELRALDPDINKTPIQRFVHQRKNAINRGIEWKMTLGEWWAIWDASGKWAERGRGHGYVMARHGDTGAYEPGNVKIIRGSENNSEYIRRFWKEVREGRRPPPKVSPGQIGGGSTNSPYGFHELDVGDAITITAERTAPQYAATVAHNYASRHGWKFKTSVDGDHVHVRRVA